MVEDARQYFNPNADYSKGIRLKEPDSDSCFIARPDAARAGQMQELEMAGHFSQRSAASASSLKLQLLKLNKGPKSIYDYLRDAKSLADQLASIKKPVSDEDLVLATLYGLELRKFKLNSLAYEGIVLVVIKFDFDLSASSLKCRNSYTGLLQPKMKCGVSILMSPSSYAVAEGPEFARN
ncbi:hypothetical protein AgCh_039050 [Apium graveolens]